MAIFIAAQTFGLSEYLSIATLAENRSLLMGFVDGHMAIAIVAFAAVVILTVIRLDTGTWHGCDPLSTSPASGRS